MGSLSTREKEIYNRMSGYDSENRLYDWFGCGSSFFITDLQENKENQERNL